jgi:hypothetical protein
MDEGGHYYTVYYTSLAVGFDENIAYRHAVLSQMADEIPAMDAAEVQMAQCLLNHKMPNLYGQNTTVNPDWRITVQKSHALSGKSYSEQSRSSAFQRSFTTQSLLKLSPLSLEFGLLLHRLGDTYAHSKIDNPHTMYTISTYRGCADSINLKSNHGHLHHGHSPDYAFLRKDIFFAYLENLYNILHQKIQEPSTVNYRRKNVTARSLAQVKFAFEDIFKELSKKIEAEEKRLLVMAMYTQSAESAIAAPMQVQDAQKALWFIQTIRDSATRTLQSPFKPYKPEDPSNFSLTTFLQAHPHLNELEITPQKIEDIFKRSSPPDGNEKNDEEFIIKKTYKGIKESIGDAITDNPLTRTFKEQVGNLENEIKKLYRIPGAM